MKLGEWLRNYRLSHEMSMQEMADACGFSKAYVSLLEKGINPTTNKPFSPTIQTFEKIASATGQSIDSLLKVIDDEQLVTVRPSPKFSSEETKLINDYRNLNRDDRRTILRLISAFLTQSKNEIASNSGNRYGFC